MTENGNNVDFARFLVERIKERGLNLKKLSEFTGISVKHLEGLVRANFENLPDAPYVRGYLEQLGRVLGFDYEDWWQKIKTDQRLKDSGAGDWLPKNRSAKKSPFKIVWLGLAAAAVLLYLILQFGRIFGKPQITVNNPKGNLLNTTMSEITLAGNVQGADELYINGDAVTLAPDGSWQKTVALQSGLNSIEVAAKKFLGKETTVIKQVFYEPPAASLTPASQTP